MYKKILVLILVFLIGIVIYSSITRDKTIHIATLGHYTSSTSTASIDAYRIIEYVINEINKEDEVYILSRFDLKDFSDLDKLRATLNETNLDIIIGPNTSSEAEPLKEFLSSLDIPVFLTTVSSNEFSYSEDNIFRINDTLIENTKQTAGVIMDREPNKSLVVFYTLQNVNFSKAFALYIKEIYTSNNLDVELIEVGDLEDKQVQKLLQEELDSDVALVIAPPGKAGIITSLVAANNKNITFYHASWGRSDATVEYLENVNNTVYSLGAVKPTYEENYSIFVNETLPEQNLIMNSFVYTSYETMYLVDAIINEIDSYKLKDVQAYIHNIGVYEGKINDFTFDKTGDGGSGYSLLVIENGQYTIVIDHLTY